jgi:hypothetical protein
MGILNPNSTNYVHPAEPNLMDLHSAMRYNASGEPQVRVHVDGISLEGDVIVDRVRLWDGTNDLTFDSSVNDGEASPTIVLPTENHNMVFNGSTWDRMRGNIADGVLTQISNDYLAVSKDTNANSDSNRIFVNATGTVELGATTLSALENITVSGSVSVSNFPATQAVTGTFWQATQPVSIATMPTTPVTGTFWQATQPVSIATMPTTPVTGTFWQATQPVSGTVTIQDGGNTITVDGAVSATVSGTVALDANTLSALENIGVTGTVELGATTLSALETTTANQGTGGASAWRISANNTDNSSGNPIYVSAAITGTVTSTVVDGAADAFGRMRVSEAFTLGDYKHTYGIDPNFRDTLSNGGTVTHITNQAAARLATSNNSSSRAVHQTKMYHNYMPGKSQLIKSTINFYGATANVTKRTGYYDDLNGIYFEQNGAGVLSFVIRTDTSGTASDARRVIQSDWNKDKCDGTGASGFNLDITKTQIFFTDFQWLGVGRVRCGFVHDGQMIVAHEFYNSNNLPVVYMSNPNLPVRCEILNTGATAGGYFDQICSTVVSEGGYVESGIDFSIDSGQTSQSITVANGMYPIVAIRLKNTFRGYPNRVVVRSGNINVYAEDYPAYWAVFKLSGLSAITLSSGTWTSANADSAVEYSLNATAFTGGDRIDGGIVGTTSPGGSAKGTGTAPVNQPSNAKKNFIAQNQDSTDSEIYVVCGKAIGGTSKLWVDLQWREIY